MTIERRATVSGQTPTNPDDAPAPTEVRRPDGQHADHWVLPESERAKGYVRPVRFDYVHVGPPAPKNPLRDLTPEELERWGANEYVKFEEYPYDGSGTSATGRFWTQAQLDKVDKGCGIKTSMPRAIAETYARQPGYYGSTFCAGCGEYYRVGKNGEFVWTGTDERVGT